MAHLTAETTIRMEHIVAALSVPPPNESAQSQFWQRYAAANGAIPSREYQPFAAQLLSQELRRLVDEWLDSGIGADGSERPLRRVVGQRGFFALRWYLDKYRPQLDLDPGAGWRVFLDIRVGHPRGIGQLLPATETEAQRLFFILLAGDLGGCLCKCRYSACGNYFISQKNREIYRSGTFCCQGHQRSAKATNHMKKTRAAARSRLLLVAAKGLDQLKAKDEWYLDNQFKLKLLNHIRLAAKRDPILRSNSLLAVHWITRNWRAIEGCRAEMK